MPPKRTTVLFVDDDAGFLEVIQDLMVACSEGQWNVLTAQDAARALAQMRDKKIDLLVIDIHMPVMDGLQFLGLLHRKYPNIVKVVLTGDAAFNHLLSLTGGQFNLKPFSEPPERTISGSWEFLLMEAARKRDEAQDPLVDTSPGDIALARAESAAAPPDLQPGADQASPELETPEAVAEPEIVPAPGFAPVRRLADTRQPKIDEVLICSSQGDVLYEWQCADANARIRFLQFLSQKSWQMRQGLPIGHFQRLEIESPKNRIVTRIDPDRALFVRTSRALLGT